MALNRIGLLRGASEEGKEVFFYPPKGFIAQIFFRVKIIYMYKIAVCVLLFLTATLGSVSPAVAQVLRPVRPNILFIAVDDLKPDIGPYGSTMVKTPNMDRIAAKGTVFLQNYCQQAVCGPTRASLMTGMRPDYTKVWDLKTRMRDKNPDILTLPQHLIAQGYSTQGIGKIYDPRCVDEQLDAPSWSVPYYKNADAYFSKESGKPAYYYQLPETKALVEQYRIEAEARGIPKDRIRDSVLLRVKPATECADVPDHAYVDGAVALRARAILSELKDSDEPFFLGVGFSKPHLPFVAPKKYWDLYRREDMPLAPFQKYAQNGPAMAYHAAGELRSYTDIQPYLKDADRVRLPEEKQRELIHAYYAAISYTDAQIGVLLDALDSLGLRENTIVVLWGDHGWHLGDHDLWCKHSNFEQATRAPLLISAPWIPPSQTRSPSEFVDVFPTLCELAAVPVPAHLQGKSLLPLMENPSARVKDFSVSQYPRSGNYSEIQRLGYAEKQFMGYSLRDQRYRYTLWVRSPQKDPGPFQEERAVAAELYDYEKDPNETRNVAADKRYAQVTAELHAKMIAFLKAQGQ